MSDPLSASPAEDAGPRPKETTEEMMRRNAEEWAAHIRTTYPWVVVKYARENIEARANRDASDDVLIERLRGIEADLLIGKQPEKPHA